MWSCIEKDKFDEFLLRNHLMKFSNDINLIETDKLIFLPKFFYKKYQDVIKYEGNRINPLSINVKFKGELRPIQKEVLAAVREKCNGDSINGIIKLYPSAGKTVLAIKISCELGLKTCIIVNTSRLLKQWTEKILQFTNLGIENIGLIQGQIFSADKPFTIAMSKTLSSNAKSNFNGFFKKIDKERFGLVFYDEVHSTLNTTLSARANLLFRTRNIIGLSGTPYHIGLPDILMKNSVGDIIFESKDYDLIPTCYIITYFSGIGDLKVKHMDLEKYIEVLKDYNIKRSVYNKYLVNSKTYLKLIRDYIKRLYEKDYIILILCRTRLQVELISELLKRNNIKNRAYYSKKTFIDEKNDKVIVATDKYCAEGFDLERLSALFIASPISGIKSVIQRVGRILRKYKGKNNPVVIDMMDLSFPMLSFPDISRKKKILKTEFEGCKIINIDGTSNINI